jgi:hypothetical protein
MTRDHGLIREALQRDLQAFVTLPAFRQLLQTRSRFAPPPTFAFTGWRFTFQRRFVMLCACEMLFPNCGPLPQMSQTCAMLCSGYARLGPLAWLRL